MVHSERIYKLNINVDLIGNYEFDGDFDSGLDEDGEDQEKQEISPSIDKVNEFGSLTVDFGQKMYFPEEMRTWNSENIGTSYFDFAY